MARFKNIGQPNYEKKLIGFEDSTGSQSLSPAEFTHQQIYHLNPVASHTSGLSDLGGESPTQSPPDATGNDEVAEPYPLFTSELVRSTRGRRPKASSAGKGAANKKSSPNRAKSNTKEISNLEFSQNESDDDLDTSGWSTDELPRRPSR